MPVILGDIAVGQCSLRKALGKLFVPSTTDEKEGCSAASGDVASSLINSHLRRFLKDCDGVMVVEVVMVIPSSPHH